MTLPKYPDFYDKEENWYNSDEPVETKTVAFPTKNERLARLQYQFASFEKRWRPAVDDELEQTFRELKDKWKSETSVLSSSTEITLNVNYQHIIGLGPSVIPLLLKDLAETRSHWFWALMAISRENPVQENDAGNVTRMTQSWLEWGHRKGYL